MATLNQTAEEIFQRITGVSYNGTLDPDTADLLNTINDLAIELGPITGTYLNDEISPGMQVGRSYSDHVTYAGAGDDVFFGKTDDLVIGETGHDIVFGGSGDDQLFGGEGDDILMEFDTDIQPMANLDFSVGAGTSVINTVPGWEPELGSRGVFSTKVVNGEASLVFDLDEAEESVNEASVVDDGWGKITQSTNIAYKSTNAYDLQVEVIGQGELADPNNLRLQLMVLKDDGTFEIVGSATHQVISSSSNGGEVYTFNVTHTAPNAALNGKELFVEIYGETTGSVSAPLEISNVTFTTDAQNAISSGDDYLSGGNGSDSLYGGSGDDILEGGNDGDVLNGGSGSDTATYINSGVEVRANLTSSSANRGEAAGDTFISIENLRGTYFSDILYGDTDDNILWGESGFDRLYGGRGNDELYGGLNNDRLYGQNGNDKLYGDEGKDYLYAGDGDDEAYGGDGDDSVYGGKGVDEIYGNDGDDTMSGSQGNDRVFGGNGNDVVRGGDDDDVVHGDAGNDYVYGERGIDLLFGDAGNDQLFGGNKDDRLYGGVGDDKLYGGNDGDLLYGDQGNDELYGQHGHDTLNGGDGNDRLFGGDGEDTLSGQADNDDLYGNDGKDALDGGAGDDILTGGDDADVLTGGAGDDIFHFAKVDLEIGNAAVGKIDIITDFTIGEDLIRLDIAGVTSLSNISIERDFSTGNFKVDVIANGAYAGSFGLEGTYNVADLYDADNFLFV